MDEAWQWRCIPIASSSMLLRPINKDKALWDYMIRHPWWRRDVGTLSALLTLCAGNPLWQYLCYNNEKYPLSPLKPKILALIEQYLPNISDPMYSVHQSFMWFLWLNWRKSTFYPVTAPNDSKCWPIVRSSLQERATSNCDVTMTDCSRMVAMDAFLIQWCWDVDREPFLL